MGFFFINIVIGFANIFFIIFYSHTFPQKKKKWYVFE